jgi:hypothetical protein
MSLIQKSPAEKLANEIDAINTEAISFIKAMMSNAFAKANTADEQQAIMDVFGTNAVNALTVYATFYSAISTLGQADGLAAPDFTLFQPQPDGTVIFVAPPEPEPAPELEPEIES